MRITPISSVPSAESCRAINDIIQSAIPDNWSMQSIQNLMALPTTFGFFISADGDQTPSGFILAAMVSGEAEILSLALYPKYQNRALGRALLRHFLDYCKISACRRIFLDVAADNPVARHVYEIMGFSAYDLRPHYYLRPGHARVDAILMQLSIGQ